MWLDLNLMLQIQSFIRNIYSVYYVFKKKSLKGYNNERPEISIPVILGGYLNILVSFSWGSG